MAFTLFNRKTVLPITIEVKDGQPDVTPPVVVTPPIIPVDVTPPVIVTPPVVVVPTTPIITTASETKYRVTGNRTFFISLLGGSGPFSFSFSRDGKVVKMASSPAADLIRVEHNLIAGDYSIVATDSQGKTSTTKTVTVQPGDADLTIVSVEEMSGRLYILLDSGRGNLGPYQVNVFSADGKYLSTVAASGTNPIETVLGVPAGTYFVQVIERAGYWSNMFKVGYQSGSSMNYSDELAHTIGGDRFGDFYDLPTVDDLLGSDDDLPDREGNVVGIKPVQNRGAYTDMDGAGKVEGGRRIRNEWGRTYWGHYFMNGVPHVDAQGMPLPFVDVSLPDNVLVTLRVIYVDPAWEKYSYRLMDRIWETRTSQGGDDNYVFGANTVHITT